VTELQGLEAIVASGFASVSLMLAVTLSNSLEAGSFVMTLIALLPIFAMVSWGLKQARATPEKADLATDGGGEL